MTGGGSVVVRRQLGYKLRQLRLKAGKDLGDVAITGVASRAKLSRIETGKLSITLSDVWALCKIYDADQATTDALAALAPGTAQDQWLEQYGRAVPDRLGLYVGLEATAKRIRCFESDVIHGLVQTPEYARAVFQVNRDLDDESIDRLVRFRLRRQETTAHVVIIMGEAALRITVGSPAIMAAQLDHLDRVAAEIRIIPFSAGAYPRKGPFAMLDFDDDDPSVVYVEGRDGKRYYDKPDDYHEYGRTWDFIESMSVPLEEWKP